MQLVIFTLVSLIYTSSVFCEVENPVLTEKSLVETTFSTEPVRTSTSVPVDNKTCDKNNGNCEKCMENKECFYCEKTGNCHAFAMGDLLPDDKCPLKDRNIGTCKMNFMVMMILIGVAVGVLIIGIICCCCCCCRRDGKIKLSKDDLKWARQREERKARAEEKRLERSARTEEIRRKYGLFKDDSPYQRFDA